MLIKCWKIVVFTKAWTVFKTCDVKSHQNPFISVFPNNLFRYLHSFSDIWTGPVLKVSPVLFDCFRDKKDNINFLAPRPILKHFGHNLCHQNNGFSMIFSRLKLDTQTDIEFGGGCF